jgi:hypothetical protein
MAVENLAVQRLILHEVFKGRDDSGAVTPRYGGQLANLPAAAMEAFRERVVDALGNTSQSMEMDIIDAQAGSAVDCQQACLGNQTLRSSPARKHSRTGSPPLKRIEVGREG